MEPTHGEIRPGAHEGAAAPVPSMLRTARLLLRGWRPEDAPALLPVLEASREHLAPWIPDRVAAPVPVDALARRLAGFAENFAAGRQWRYGVFDADSGAVLGEAAMFPRAAGGRVPFAEADRVEIGYWLRADATGRGYATEAAEALVSVARGIPGMLRIEIRLDPRNRPSAAVPRRLGFRPAPDEAPTDSEVWILALGGSGDEAGPAPGGAA